MPRTLDSNLENALATGLYKPYFRALLYIEADDPSPSFTVTTVTKYRLTPDTLHLEGIYRFGIDDFDQLGFIIFRRGVTVGGNNYYIDTSKLAITKGSIDGNYLRVDAELLPHTRVSFLSDTMTWAEALDQFTTEIGWGAEFTESSDTFWDNQFLPTGRSLNLNRAMHIKPLLKQKGFVGYTDQGNDTLLFFSARTTATQANAAYTITTAKLVEMTENNPAQFTIGLLWRDESNTTFQPADGGRVLYNIGFMKTGDTLPTDAGSATTNRVKNIPKLLKPLTLQMNLNYQTGDRVHVVSSTTNVAVDGYLEVTEYLDTDAELAWGIEITLWDYVGKNEGGALPSTIEAAAPYTPLNTNEFAGILDETDNNIQAAMETIDDHTHGNLAQAIQAPTATNDFLVGTQIATIWTWTKKTLAETITILRTSLDGIFAPIAKGVTNGDSHDHNGGDGAQIDHGGLAGLADDDHTQYVKKSTLEGKHYLPFGVFTNINPLTATNDQPYTATVDRNFTLIQWVQGNYVVTTNDNSNYWTIVLSKAIPGSADAVVASFDTRGNTASQWNTDTISSFSPAAITAGNNANILYIAVTKTGAPGNLYLAGPAVEISI